jgi:hypothetical protein
MILKFCSNVSLKLCKALLTVLGFRLRNQNKFAKIEITLRIRLKLKNWQFHKMYVCYSKNEFKCKLQWPPLNGFSLGPSQAHSINRMIPFSDTNLG